MLLTTDDLIENIKLRASLPTSQELYTTERFIQILNSEMKTKLIPFIMRMKESHFISQTDVTLENGRDYINFPQDALGQTILDLFINKERVALNHLAEKENSNYGIYLEGYKIRFKNPDYYRNKTITIYYYKRPLTLISTSKTAKVIGINGNIIDLDTNVSSFNVSTELELINCCEPFESKGTLTIVNRLANKQIEVNDGSLISLNDYLSPKNYTPIPQIPLEAFELLTQRCVIKCLEGIKDDKGVNMAMADYNNMEREISTLLSPRTGNIYKKFGSSDSLWNSW
ncbi:hypothetical protein EHR02_00120 [Leptospira levettii]|uniref:hypothetical protein n=1 Tax=Leptospira levettii TaxID=2023178 RepID=UPI0010838C8C|nr:hypothetical protein [Leptospira levettii]TGM95043.1 hypothetical protein EHR02_00120 [Leptospira levettii]